MSAVESAGRHGIIAVGPQASASSVLLAVSYKVAKQTGDKDLQQKVKTALGYDALSLSGDAFWNASQVRVINDVFSNER